MNPTEHILEVYFRLVKRSFTISDWKVIKGNNRQFDLLCYDSINNKHRHVEISVTHHEHWTANLKKVEEDMARKFFGEPRKRTTENSSSDQDRGKSYLKPIKDSYKLLGMKWEEVIRVWCLWKYDESEKEIIEWKQQLAEKYDLMVDNFELLSFRDEVIPSLYQEIGTPNYSDEVLRTISLLKQYRSQVGDFR